MTERERFPADWDPKANGYLAGVPMPDGRYWCLLLLTFGRLRIVIAEDRWTAGEHWCYEDNAAALGCYIRGSQFVPTGWKRHMRPDGTYERVLPPVVSPDETPKGVEEVTR